MTTYNFTYALVGFENIIATEVLKNLIVKVVFLCCVKILNSVYIFIHYCDHRQCLSFNLAIKYILNNSQTSIILLIRNDHMSCNLFNRIWSIKLSMHRTCFYLSFLVFSTCELIELHFHIYCLEGRACESHPEALSGQFLKHPVSSIVSIYL